jgi:hypothetical protein
MAAYQKEPSIESFGAKLLSTGDLDPLYIALHKAKLSPDHLRRWLFAYWCCYHAGASSYISEGEGIVFWSRLFELAHNVTLSPLGARWPRGHERRHFRGEKATNAVAYLSRNWSRPEDLVGWMEAASPSFYEIRERVLALPQFGPWIAFKIGDMLERIVGTKIDFTDADVMMFKSPYEAALDVGRTWSENQGPVTKVIEKSVISGVVTTLILSFQHRLAPPAYDRPVNVQEIETILCKWKSHLNGFYPVGLDTNEIRHGLEEWSKVSETAEKLRGSAPR